MNASSGMLVGQVPTHRCVLRPRRRHPLRIAGCHPAGPHRHWSQTRWQHHWRRYHKPQRWRGLRSRVGQYGWGGVVGPGNNTGWSVHYCMAQRKSALPASLPATAGNHAGEVASIAGAITAYRWSTRRSTCTHCTKRRGREKSERSEAAGVGGSCGSRPPPAAEVARAQGIW